MIERERMIETFIDLAQIDSPSREERAVAEQLTAWLRHLGCEVAMDDAGERVGGDCGNLWSRLPGTGPGPPVLLSAHMDTVMPGRGVRPVRTHDRIASDGTTILGADDKSGLAIIVEVLRVLRERRLAHPPVEVVLTVCEEAGLLGAKQADMRRVTARDGLVLDSCPAGALFTRGPAADRLDVTIRGVAAHAGVCPEAGVSAIRVAASAIAGMRLGRIDADTTANLGLIDGGTAVNIVPDRVRIQGEARSHDEAKLAAQSQHMVQCFHTAAAEHGRASGQVEIGAQIEAKVTRDYNRMDLGDQAPIVGWVRQAAHAIGVSIECQKTGGGCDANVFNAHGLSVGNLGTGMRQIHTTDEHLLLDEFSQTAHVVLAMLQRVGR